MSQQTLLWRCKGCESGDDDMDVLVPRKRWWTLKKSKPVLVARCKNCGQDMELVGVC